MPFVPHDSFELLALDNVPRLAVLLPCGGLQRGNRLPRIDLGRCQPWMLPTTAFWTTRGLRPTLRLRRRLHWPVRRHQRRFAMLTRRPCPQSSRPRMPAAPMTSALGFRACLCSARCCICGFRACHYSRPLPLFDCVAVIAHLRAARRPRLARWFEPQMATEPMACIVCKRCAGALVNLVDSGNGASPVTAVKSCRCPPYCGKANPSAVLGGPRW